MVFCYWDQERRGRGDDYFLLARRTNSNKEDEQGRTLLLLLLGMLLPEGLGCIFLVVIYILLVDRNAPVSGLVALLRMLSSASAVLHPA